MKTGTELDLNHIKARRMKATTGTERITTTQGCMKASNLGFRPPTMPKAMPTTTAMAKPIKPRKMVLPITVQKLFSAKSKIVVFKVVAGPGKICSEPNVKEATSHSSSMMATEMTTIQVCLFLVEFFIGHLFSYDFRLHVVEHFQVSLHLGSGFFHRCEFDM